MARYFALFAAAFVVYAWLCSEAPVIEGDSSQYLEVARDLIDLRLDTLHDRSTGYPLFLVLTGSAGGVTRQLFHASLVLHLAMAAIGAATILSRCRAQHAPATTDPDDTDANTGCVNEPRRWTTVTGTAARTPAESPSARTVISCVSAAKSRSSAYGRALAAWSRPSVLHATISAVRTPARRETTLRAATPLTTAAAANAAIDSDRNASSEVPNTRVQPRSRT